MISHLCNIFFVLGLSGGEIAGILIILCAIVAVVVIIVIIIGIGEFLMNADIDNLSHNDTVF